MKISIYQIYQTNIEAQLNGQIVLIYDPKGNGEATLIFDEVIVSAEMENWVCKKTPNNQTWTFTPNVEGRRNVQKFPYWNNDRPNIFPTRISYQFTAVESMINEVTVMIPDDGSGDGGHTGGN